MNLQSFTDKTAISLSAICIIHCLALPVFLILFPSVLMATVSDEMFHQWILFGILPLSIIALVIGFMHHGNYSVLIISLLGLLLLIGTAFIGHTTLGEYGEAIMTILGSSIIAYGHFRNSRLRKLLENVTMEHE